MPQDLSSLTLRIARYGRPSVLGAHYAGVGVLIFRRAEGNRWLLADTLEELYSVADTYKGKHFGIAQSLACLRGETFRVYVKDHGREIRRDADLAWALAHRLSRTPESADRLEEDGMLVAVKLLVTSRQPDTLAMLKQIGAAPGEKGPQLARDYAAKIEREAPTREARRLKAEKQAAESGQPSQSSSQACHYGLTGEISRLGCGFRRRVVRCVRFSLRRRRCSGSFREMRWPTGTKPAAITS
jgi:hypothetical protein